MEKIFKISSVKKIQLIIGIFLIYFQQITYSQSVPNFYSLKKLENTHDLNLPAWGPYTKRYIGISHIPDIKSGLRFDLSVFPGFYRRKVEVPDVLYENDYHPWDSSPNLEYFCFRHELEWKDQVYTDISYSKISTKARLIRIECVNNTNENENLALHFMASMNFPPIKEYTYYIPIYPSLVKLPVGAQWFDALNYEDLKFNKTRPTDNLVYDGKMRGEIRENGFVNGSGIGLGFGLDKDDIVSYKMNVENNYKNAVLLIRYRIVANQKVAFILSGMSDKENAFTGTNGFAVDTVKLGHLDKGIHELTLNSNGGYKFKLTGL